jgi:Family of unknown function (DUF6159)
MVPEGRWDRSLHFLARVWDLLRGDRALIVVAAVGTLLNALAAVIIFGGAALLIGDVDYRVLGGVTAAALAFPVTVVSTYCNVALIRMAEARFEGRRCTTREGFRAANRRLPRILGWSLLAVGVGAVLDKIAEKVPFGGAVASWLLGAAWSLGTMFAIPVLALEDVGPLQAAKRSTQIFRARWGEGMIGTFGVGFVSVVLAIPGLALLMVGFGTGGTVGVPLFVVGGVLLIVAATVSRALEELFALAIYRHQVQGAGAFGLPPEQLDRLVDLKARRGT